MQITMACRRPCWSKCKIHSFRFCSTTNFGPLFRCGFVVLSYIWCRYRYCRPPKPDQHSYKTNRRWTITKFPGVCIIDNDSISDKILFTWYQPSFLNHQPNCRLWHGEPNPRKSNSISFYCISDVSLRSEYLDFTCINWSYRKIWKMRV
jgi:hypothetical protein